MLIVRPYGRSATDFDANGTLRRALRQRPDHTRAEDIREFAEHHPELLVAQWISALDRIASKPRANAKPTREQRALRDRLGQAAWELLKERLPPDRADELEKLWWRKIHPYGDTNDNQTPGRGKGRWYARFAGGAEPGEVGIQQAAEIARRIGNHLNRQECRIAGGRQDKRKERIASRAESIAGNVVAPVNPDVAARSPFAHCSKLFRGDDGRPLGIADAEEQEPSLFALHMAVCEI